MTLKFADRVRETTTTTGTGQITLGGAASGGFQTFSSILANGDTCYYVIQDSANSAWEVGVGTYVSSGNKLTRTTILVSSVNGSVGPPVAVTLASGSKDVFITLPAMRVVGLAANGPLPQYSVLFTDANGQITQDEAAGFNYNSATGVLTVPALNQIAAYNSQTTAGQGLPPILAVSDKTAQAAATGTITLLTAPAAGLYRVNYYIVTSTAGSAGTTGINIGWNDATAVSQTASSASVSLTTLGAFAQGQVILWTDGSHNIRYSTNFAGVTGSPKFDVHVAVERLN